MINSIVHMLASEISHMPLHAVWWPGDYSGITIEEYTKTLKITAYGEPVRDYEEE